MCEANDREREQPGECSFVFQVDDTLRHRRSYCHTAGTFETRTLRIPATGSVDELVITTE
jgi:hypothetical protein